MLSSLAQIKLWSTVTFANFFTLKGHSNAVGAAHPSEDGARIVSSSWVRAGERRARCCCVRVVALGLQR